MRLVFKERFRIIETLSGHFLPQSRSLWSFYLWVRLGNIKYAYLKDAEKAVAYYRQNNHTVWEEDT